MKVAFHSNQLSERGTEVALYKYAKYNEEILGNESIIISSAQRHNQGLSKFTAKFPVFLYDDQCMDGVSNDTVRVLIEDICAEQNVDVFYAIKAGENDGIIPTNVKTAMHCVFRMPQPHGDVYASICKYLSEKSGEGYSYVHHILEKEMPDVTDNLRSELGIPEDVLVLGRHGGNDTFSLPIYGVISKALESREDLWFVFLNTNKFIDHPRVIFLPMSIDEEYKAKFINTCDGMIHARADGEMFSMSVAEFVIRNKPIITWNPKQPPTYYDTGHIYLLKESGIYYETEQDLFDILMMSEKENLNLGSWDNFTADYTPEKVMEEFRNVFLS